MHFQNRENKQTNAFVDTKGKKLCRSKEDDGEKKRNKLTMTAQYFPLLENIDM